MKTSTTKLALLLACSLALPTLTWADPAASAPKGDESVRARMGQVSEETPLQRSIDAAASVYASVVYGQHGKVPESVLMNAHCIAVLPNLMSGALIVGGTHGEGLASCKDAKGTWSQPSAISFNEGSIGVQVGAKATALVMFFETPDSESILKRGSFNFGTDLTAAAGDYDSTNNKSKTGVVVYSRSEGAFLGASLTSGKMAIDREENERLYGKKIEHVALLAGLDSPDKTGATENLISLFPK